MNLLHGDGPAVTQTCRGVHVMRLSDCTAQSCTTKTRRVLHICFETPFDSANFERACSPSTGFSPENHTRCDLIDLKTEVCGPQRGWQTCQTQTVGEFF